MVTNKLYTTVVSITEEYLGPSADRFVGRQVEFHFNKRPEELTKRDLKKLSEWVKVSIGTLTDDRKVVDEYTRKIEQLSH